MPFTVMPTPQERIEEGLRTGSPVTFHDDDDCDVSAKWLADLLSGRTGPAARHHRGLTIEGAYINGPTDTASIDWSHDTFITRFLLRECTFSGQVEGKSLRVKSDASFERCTLQSLDLSNGRFDGDLNLAGANLLGGEAGVAVTPTLNLKGFTTAGSLRLTGISVEGEACINAADISGHLDLADAKLHNPQGFALDGDSVKISKGGYFSSSTLEGTVSLIGSEIGYQLVFSGAKLSRPAGDVLLCSGKIAPVFLDGIEAEGTVDFVGIEIDGPLILSGAKLHQPGGNALIAANARINGSLFLQEGFEAEGTVSFDCADIQGGFYLSGAKIHQAGGVALAATNVKLTKDALLTDGFEAEGTISFAGTEIGGQLNLSEAKLHQPGGDALIAANARINGNALLLNGFEAEGTVSFDDAEIGGGLFLTGAQLHAPGGIPLSATNTKVTDVRAAGGFAAEGMVNFYGAEISGGLYLTGAKLHEPDGIALFAADSQIMRGAVLDDVEAQGTINFQFAEIRGIVSLSGAKLHQPGGLAIAANNARITDTAYLYPDFEADGTVSFDGAEIGGRLVLAGAKLRQPGGDALSADNARIAQTTVLDEVETEGTVNLAEATIGGGLGLSSARLQQPEGNALFARTLRVDGDMQCEETAFAGVLNVSQMSVSGSFTVSGCTLDSDFVADAMDVKGAFVLTQSPRAPAGKVSLRKARVGQLDDDPASWPVAAEPKDPPSLDLTGFVYEQFGETGVEEWSSRQRLDWLRVQTQREYAPQPYLQLAEVYRQDGRDKERRKVLIAKQDDLRRYGILSPQDKLWNVLLRYLTGHGHEAWRAAIAIVILYCLSVGLIWQVKVHDGFIPVGTTADQVVSVEHHFVLPSNTCTKYYPCISIAIYPIDAALPVLNLHQSDYWAFNAHNTWGDRGRIFFTIFTLLGWIFTSFLVAALAGLIRSD
jgi:hypothetical protein